MRRQYRLNPFRFDFGPKGFLELAKLDYSRRYPSLSEPGAKHPFAYCLMYLVIAPNKTMNFEFRFPQDTPLAMEAISKKPRGFQPGEPVQNVDIREITRIVIPPYNSRYYFDFIVAVLDTTTDEYWIGNLWTQKVCSDLSYYLSGERKRQYRAVGTTIARKYTTTFMLGHVNLKSGGLRSSRAIARLAQHGWIPTVSLLPQPYGEMVRMLESANDMARVSVFAVRVFDATLLQDILARWSEASLVRDRKQVLAAAIASYKSGDYVTPVYTLLPQIEGLITAHIKRKRLPLAESITARFRQFGDVIKSETFNTEFTHYLTDVLVSNLTNAFYRAWYPYPRSGKQYQASTLSPQRNVVLHGEVKSKYFTAENCVKLICVLDAVILLSLRKAELQGR